MLPYADMFIQRGFLYLMILVFYLVDLRRVCKHWHHIEHEHLLSAVTGESGGGLTWNNSAGRDECYTYKWLERNVNYKA